MPKKIAKETKIRKCTKCNGEGIKRIPLRDVPNHFSVITCEHCNGKGYLYISNSPHSHIFEPTWKDFVVAIENEKLKESRPED